MSRSAQWFLVVWCAACTSPQGEEETESETGFESADGVAPYMVEGEVSCLGEEDAASHTWSFEVIAADPQGTDTLNALQDIGAFTVIGEAEIFRTSGLACAGDGSCIGSLREDQVGILCKQQDEYTFYAYLTDVDDNEAPGGFPLTWVQPSGW